MCIRLVPRLLISFLPILPALAEPPTTRSLNDTSPQEESRVARFEDFKFDDPEVGRRMRRIDAATRELAQPSWQVKPYHLVLPKYGTWTAWWATPAATINRYGDLDPSTKLADDEIRVIRLEANGTRGSFKAIHSFHLVAIRRAPDDEWGASVVYECAKSDSTICQFQISIGRRTKSPSKTDGKPSDDGQRGDLGFFYRSAAVKRNSLIFEDLTCFQRVRTYGGTRYYLAVDIGGPEFSDEEVNRWFASPESLRDTAQAYLDRLSHQIEADFASGAVIKRAYDEEYFRSGGPNPGESSRQMTDAEKALILAEARAEIESSRTLIQTHFREMHAALLKTFPLAECLR